MSLRRWATFLVLSGILSVPARADNLPVVPFGRPPLEALRLYNPTGVEDSLEVLDNLRRRVSRDRNDVEARRELASLLSVSSSIRARQEAAQALDRALLLAPEDPDLWLRLGLLRQRQKFWAESRRTLERAWELAPDWFFLSEILAQIQLAEFQRSHREEYFEDAAYYNRKVLESGEPHASTFKREIRLDFMRGDSVTVLDSVLTAWESTCAPDAWFHLIRGWRAFRDDDWETAAAYFDRGKSLLPLDQQGDFFTLDIVDPREQELTKETPDSVRTITDWWHWHDPTPSDPLNPRLLEHDARMVEADLLFGRETKKIPGWRHAPGEMLVRYGLPKDFDFFKDVQRHVGHRLFNTSAYQPTALLIRFGADHDLTADFLDFAMNGNLVRSFDPSLDQYIFAQPSFAPLPFTAEPRKQDIEVWRFGAPDAPGRLEIAVALPPESWSAEALDHGAALESKLAVYDSLWTVVDTTRWNWGGFERDPFGRLVASWSLEAPRDSLVLGLETGDPRGKEWAGSFQILPPATANGELALSDLAFYRGLDVDDGTSPYARQGLKMLPNPGHVYLPGEPVALGFEVYGLKTDPLNRHRAKIAVSVMRQGRKGVWKVLVGEGASRQGLVFTARGEGSTTSQSFSVDMPSLSQGDYFIEVRITDQLGRSTVSLRDHIRVDHEIKR